MKTVDIIFPGSLSQIIGPTGTMKRILKNQDYFKSRGYEVTIYTNDSLNNEGCSPSISTVVNKVSIKNKFRRRVGSFLRMHAKKHLRLAQYFLEKEHKSVEALVDYYISLNRTPDIVEFHSNYECMLYLRRRKEKNAKTVMFLHSDGIPFKMTLLYYPCLKGTAYFSKMMSDFEWTVANTDRVVFIAKNGQKNFLNLFPERSIKDTSVIINGIDDLTGDQKKEVDIIRKDSESSAFNYRLCCSGTINTRKGHRLIIEALYLLPQSMLSQIHVDFMGEGPERPELEQLTREYGLDNNITFCGIIPNSDIYKYLARNNVYILMSMNEGLPISIIEAMRAGLAIISTNVSGIPELVENEFNGFLLNPDKNELAEVLNNMSKFDWKKMGHNSRMRYENEFTFDRMKCEFCDMFDILTKDN